MNGISLVLNKSEIGAGTRGSSLGPEAIEVAAINEQSEIFNRYKRVKIVHLYACAKAEIFCMQKIRF